MPDILTHLIGADEALKTIRPHYKKTLLANRNFYNLGAQGPDIFFYHHILPWQKNTSIDAIGTRLHEEKTQEFILKGAQLIKQNFTGDAFEFFKKENLQTDAHKKFSYLAGFLTHYALDIHCHPYIFYFSGHEGGYNHKYFECILDTMIHDIYHAKQKKLHKTGKAIQLASYDNLLIANYLNYMIYKTYEEDIPSKEIVQTIKDMRSTMTAMYDPLSLKKNILKSTDKIVGAGGKIITAKFPVKYDSKVDYLNLKHNEWYHPCDQKMLKTESFLDCLKLGIETSAEMIIALARYITHEIPTEEFKAIIENNRYDTGLPIELYDKMLYSNPILDYKKTYKIGDSK
ncbi:MAG: zinc dependent phospholipase C family protein [Clostridia bacterium]|nr:zinc dependent phospholipase C family protein [Clostridia bacterium]